MAKVSLLLCNEFYFLTRGYYMSELTPLQILLDDFLTPDQQGQIEGEAHKAGNSPAVKTLGSLRTPQKGNDPTELIENRFLYRCGEIFFADANGDSFFCGKGIVRSLAWECLSIERDARPHYSS